MHANCFDALLPEREKCFDKFMAIIAPLTLSDEPTSIDDDEKRAKNSSLCYNMPTGLYRRPS